MDKELYIKREEQLKKLWEFTIFEKYVLQYGC